VGGLVWWRNAAYDPTFDAWRLYQLAALSDPALVRDHHTRVLSRNTSVFLDRRARQCEALGRIDDAQDAYRRALVADPANDATMANFGNLLARLGRFDEAIAWYRQALAVNPREPRHHANLAIILEAAGKPDDAARARREALTGTSP
jgi:tetratricopeptide (TPR) repeat protein